MSLHKAVEKVVGLLKADVRSLECEDDEDSVFTVLITKLEGRIQLLELALEMDQDDPPVDQLILKMQQKQQEKTEQVVQRRLQIEKEEIKTQLEREEMQGGFKECVGGSLDGDVVEANLPIGAFTPLCGQVYQLQKDGRLHFSEEQTKRYLESVGK